MQGNPGALTCDELYHAMLISVAHDSTPGTSHSLVLPRNPWLLRAAEQRLPVGGSNGHRYVDIPLPGT